MHTYIFTFYICNQNKIIKMIFHSEKMQKMLGTGFFYHYVYFIYLKSKINN